MGNTKLIVLAFGGNAIIRQGQYGDIHTQFANTREVLEGIVEPVKQGAGLIIVHGNGPQVGHELIRSQTAHPETPELPLGVLVADTEGGMGYMIQQCLQNVLWKNSIKKPVVTILTQVEVDRNDPKLKNPTKPVGRFFTKEEADLISREKGWKMKEDSGRGWRMVVPSPEPIKIIEHKTISKLVNDGVIIIAGGGGGIPIIVEENGNFEGQDVVIDKDLTAALIGNSCNADTLIVATDISKVSLNFNTPDQINLDRISVAEAKKYLKEGHFAEGSMGPKISASIKFLENGGESVVICSPGQITAALEGKAGTVIYS